MAIISKTVLNLGLAQHAVLCEDEQIRSWMNLPAEQDTGDVFRFLTDQIRQISKTLPPFPSAARKEELLGRILAYGALAIRRKEVLTAVPVSEEMADMRQEAYEQMLFWLSDYGVKEMTVQSFKLYTNLPEAVAAQVVSIDRDGMLSFHTENGRDDIVVKHESSSESRERQKEHEGEVKMARYLSLSGLCAKQTIWAKLFYAKRCHEQRAERQALRAELLSEYGVKEAQLARLDAALPRKK